ncbi:MAG TPA: hypothetical protein VEZ40_02710 [Pyrinomonadaceae bacterium]|nr:hypothetical protein [Pyrinomonadaceae bacterium]
MNLRIFCLCVVACIILRCDDYGSSGLAQTQPSMQFSNRLDEFGNITCEDEMARLDNLSVHLQSNPGYQGYMIVYGGRRGKRDEARARAARMKFYLVRIRGLSAERIITINGGYREEQTTELWLLPPGQPAPIPTPTVKAKDVRLRGRVKVRGYNCGAFIG